MDGIHDLGGRHGFGPIDVNEPEEPFHAAWEGRVWGLVRSLTRLPGWSIDWFRHCRELIEPVDYLSRPYYDQWAQSYAAMLVSSGAATVAEIVNGKSRGPLPGLRAPTAPDKVPELKVRAVRFDRESNAAPAFALGATVRAKRDGRRGHTRLPAYARGRRGVIEAYHGAHVLPDASAQGEERAEPLYPVVFDAAELWPEAAGRRERVFLDLWQSYLEPA